VRRSKANALRFTEFAARLEIGLIERKDFESLAGKLAGTFRLYHG
jgi:hypothetical protein